MKNAKWFCIVLILCKVFSFMRGEAQVKTGFPPFSSTTGGPDAINLANLNVHWSFPIFSKAGRGLPFSYSLQYDSSIWVPELVQVGTTWVKEWQPSSDWGWPNHDFAALERVTYTVTQDESTGCQFYGNWIYTDGMGTPHSFEDRKSTRLNSSHT